MSSDLAATVFKSSRKEQFADLSTSHAFYNERGKLEKDSTLNFEVLNKCLRCFLQIISFMNSH